MFFVLREAREHKHSREMMGALSGLAALSLSVPGIWVQKKMMG